MDKIIIDEKGNTLLNTIKDDIVLKISIVNNIDINEAKKRFENFKIETDNNGMKLKIPIKINWLSVREMNAVRNAITYENFQ